MKSLFQKFALIAICCPSLIYSQSNIQWDTLNSGTNKKINDILFLNADTGYIVGDNYLFKKTTDGGLNWVDLPTPTMGQRPGNNGNIIAIAHTGPIMFAAPVDSGLIMVWEKPYHAVHTNDDGSSYSPFNTYDSLICTAKGFSVQSTKFPIYKAMGAFGKSCTGGGVFSGYYAGSFSIGLGFSYGSTGSFTSVDYGQNIIAAHEDGSLLVVDFSSNTKDTVFLDSSGVSSISYAGNNTWYATTLRNTYNMYISVDSGKTFNIDSTLFPSFFYPKFNEMEFLSDSVGIAGGSTGGGNIGVIVVKLNGFWMLSLSEEPINAVEILPNNLMYAAGDSGLIMKATVTVGLEEVRKFQTMEVYPNPADQVVFIEVANDAHIPALVTDLQGQSKKVQIINGKLDLKNLAAGMYFLRFKYKKVLYSAKIVLL